MPRLTITKEQLKRGSAEIIPNKLHFVSFDGNPPIDDDIFCFSIDDELIYEEFCYDFGPLHLGHTYNFCAKVNAFLQEPELSSKEIYFYCRGDKKLRSNAAVLICSFSVLCLGKTPDEAYKPLSSILSTFEPFHDASYYPCPFILTVKDCVDGLYRAWKLNFFSYPDFPIDEYEYYGDIEHGDLNWLVQGKFLAFTGPFAERKHYGNGYYSSVPSDFISYFKKRNVTAVIRLNKACYDAEEFTKHGINHYHLFYPDGGNPPAKILDEFIEICEREKGAIAVHCKAGLGRTGTCIGMYLMKHFDITAKEIIGYFRIARPGSVIGPQQDYLQEHQHAVRLKGLACRDEILEKRRKTEGEELSPFPTKRGSRLETPAEYDRRLMIARRSLLVRQSDTLVNVRSSFVSEDGKIKTESIRTTAVSTSARNGSIPVVHEEGVDGNPYAHTGQPLEDRKTKDILVHDLGDILEETDTQGDILNKLKAHHHHQPPSRKSLKKHSMIDVKEDST